MDQIFAIKMMVEEYLRQGEKLVFCDVPGIHLIFAGVYLAYYIV